MLVLSGLNYPKRIRIKVSADDCYREIGSRFLEFQNKQRLKQQLGVIELRARKQLNDNLLGSRDFNEVKRLLNRINKW